MDLDSDLRLPQGVAQVSSEDPVANNRSQSKTKPNTTCVQVFCPKKAAARGSIWLELKQHKHQQHNSKF